MAIRVQHLDWMSAYPPLASWVYAHRLEARQKSILLTAGSLIRVQYIALFSDAHLQYL